MLNDLLMAPAYYWGLLQEKNLSIIKNRKSRLESDSYSEYQKKKYKTEIKTLYTRNKNLRKSILHYLTNTIFYVIRCVGYNSIGKICTELLSLTQNTSTSSFLNRISKDIKSAGLLLGLSKDDKHHTGISVKRLCTESGLDEDYLARVHKPVSANYTSFHHYVDSHKFLLLYLKYNEHFRQWSYIPWNKYPHSEKCPDLLENAEFIKNIGIEALIKNSIPTNINYTESFRKANSDWAICLYDSVHSSQEHPIHIFDCHVSSANNTALRGWIYELFKEKAQNNEERNSLATILGTSDNFDPHPHKADDDDKKESLDIIPFYSLIKNNPIGHFEDKSVAAPLSPLFRLKEMKMGIG